MPLLPYDAATCCCAPICAPPRCCARTRVIALRLRAREAPDTDYRRAHAILLWRYAMPRVPLMLLDAAPMTLLLLPRAQMLDFDALFRSIEMMLRTRAQREARRVCARVLSAIRATAFAARVRAAARLLISAIP